MLGVVLTALCRGGSSFSAVWSSLEGKEDVKETCSDSKLAEQRRGAAGEPRPCPQPGAAGRECVAGVGLGLGQVCACSSGTQKHLAGIGMQLLFFLF